MNINLINKILIIFTISAMITVSAFAQTSRRTSTVKRSVSSAWKSYNLCRNSVSADLPVEPKEELQSSDALGAALTTRTSRVKLGKAIYLVSCTENLPIVAEQMSVEMKRVFFKGMMDDFSRQVSENMILMGFTAKMSLLPVKETTIDLQSGLEQDFTIAGQRGSSKIAFVGNRIVWLLAMMSDETAQTRFFNSVKITGIFTY